MSNRQPSPIPAVLFVGMLMLVVSSWRLIDNFGVSAESSHPAISQWVITGLYATNFFLFAIASCMVVLSMLYLTGLVRAGEWFLIPAFAMIFWIVAYGVLSLYGEITGGGIVPGFFHAITLNRSFSGTTETTMMAYRMGQCFGFLIWFIVPVLLFAAYWTNMTSASKTESDVV